MMGALLAVCFVAASTPVDMCAVSDALLPSAFLAAGDGSSSPPWCKVVDNHSCGLYPCDLLGGIVGGCYGLPLGTNWLFNVPDDPAPGEALFVSFEPL